MPLPIVAHPAYAAPLPSGHRFPMPKYVLLAARLRELGLAPNGFLHPEPAPRELVCRAHDASYVDQVFTNTVPREIERRIGLPVDEGVTRRARMSSSGTLMAARLALRHGLAGNAAGGSHHAQRGTGAGFCVFNDVAIAARHLRHEGEIARAVVIDLDVHQGDGTADCLSDEPDLFTFSVHAEKNYPVRKIPSDLDVALPDGVDDAGYLDILKAHVPRLLDALQPDLVFYNAGVDPHADDSLGRLALTDDGLRARDAYVVGEAHGRGVPLVAVIGGGYGPDPAQIARRHAFVFEALAALV